MLTQLAELKVLIPCITSTRPLHSSCLPSQIFKVAVQWFKVNVQTDDRCSVEIVFVHRRSFKNLASLMVIISQKYYITTIYKLNL